MPNAKELNFSNFHRLSHPPGMLPGVLIQGYSPGCSPGTGVLFSHDIHKLTRTFPETAAGVARALLYSTPYGGGSSNIAHGIHSFSLTNRIM